MWNFTPAGGAATMIQVPGGGWLKQGITATSGTYATAITVPDSGGPQTTVLEFGAVDNQAALSIDGTMVGTQTTTLTPQVYDITKFAQPGTQHTISVAVKSFKALMANGQYLVPDPAPWSANVALGILRSAMVRVYPSVYISDVFVRTSVANDSLTYDVSLTNTAATDQQVSLSGALSSWNCDANTYPAIATSMVTVPAGMTQVTTVGPISWGLGQSSYWWPNVPYVQGYQAKLHNLKVDMSVGGQVKHEQIVRFGFREIQMKRADAMHVYYYLNGVHVRLHGDNLQGADYDSIINGGQGDAYDTLPGFLPPSAQNAGWPGAVANYQKLNYNFIRVHQELASPYMLDTADELGLMLMGETSIRGSNGDEDFVNGHDNMVNHAKAMVLRDRNHPAIIRWSQSNEPDLESTDSNQFEGDLYTAVNTLDPTRPVSVDGPTNKPYGIGAYGTNFATFGHYNSGLGNYSEEVNATPNQPFGQGEFIWPADSTRKGLMWFATACESMRLQDASDIRPYALLSGFSSIIPGTTSKGMAIETSSDPTAANANHPLFGEDNLPDPWSNPIIERIQNAYNPMLVADEAYWEANKMSDNNGDWPVSTSIPTLTKGSMSSRTLLIFNDTFSGASIDVTWEVHAGSPTGAIASMGTLSSLMVPLGTMATQTVNITAPTSGTQAYLVLRSQKSGTQTTVFEEDGEYFTLN